MPWRRPGRSVGGAGPRITLVDRAGCHLCEQARSVVEAVAQRTGVGWTRVEVDSSAELGQYADRVPVILVDGREVAHWVITEEQLRKALRRWPGRARR